jgi:NADH-quinone oxidoreductase subunit J
MPAVVALFWAFGALAVGAALLCITRRNPVASALWLVVTLFAVAALFVMLDAQFVAVLQILVYAGAIMVLFLFVIMLLNLGRGGPNDLKGPVGLAVAAGLGAVLFLELRELARLPGGAAAAPGASPVARAAAEQGMVAAVARPLFQTYLVPFEITSLLLLAALVGAVVLAKRRL